MDKKLQKIERKIFAAKDPDEIILDLIEEIADMFLSERITIYFVDGAKMELVSKFTSKSEVEEIRLPVSKNSIAGYAALERVPLNIKNVGDKKELFAIDPELRFDETWDKKTGFATRQTLAVPIIFREYLLGVIQLMNRIDKKPYTEDDEAQALELARIIGIALHKQKQSAELSYKKCSYLIKNNILSAKELKRAILDALKEGVSIEFYLMNQLDIPKKQIGASLGNYYQVPFIEFSENLSPPKQILKNIKTSFMRTNMWVPVRMNSGKVLVAVDDPHNFQKIGEIKSLFPNNPIEICVAFEEDILDFIRNFTSQRAQETATGSGDIPPARAQGDMDTIVQSVGTMETRADTPEERDNQVASLANRILQDGHKAGASDIHIEPRPENRELRIRFRVDGNCITYPVNIPAAYRGSLISHFKLMAGLKVAERNLPQYGKILMRRPSGTDAELRAVATPTYGGAEALTMRFLSNGPPIPLGRLGFSERNLRVFTHAVQQPYGLILVSGPTSSGKTSMLHSALSHINRSGMKIWTAESPVEITQAGLNQVEVRPKGGLGYQEAMQAILSSDPNVIMIGRVNEKDVAEIALDAALRGHLVLTALYANASAEGITRLLEMGVNAMNFSNSFLCILAQKLVRTLCPNCKLSYTPKEEQYQALVEEYGEEAFSEDMDIPYSGDLTLYKASGCKSCSKTGYRKRTAVHEVLNGTGEIKRIIKKNGQTEELNEEARNQGMRTIRQDSIRKMFSGVTDEAEIRRVCLSDYTHDSSI